MSDPELVGVVTGLTKASWGTSGGATSTLGYVYGCTHKMDGEKDAVYDGNGFTVGQIFFDDQDVLSIEILALDAATQPSRGDSLTVDSIIGVVQDSEVKWAHKGWKMFTVNATKFANMTLA